MGNGNQAVPVPNYRFYASTDNTRKIQGPDGATSQLQTHFYNLGTQDSHYLHFPFQPYALTPKQYVRVLPKNLILYKGRRIENAQQFQKLHALETQDNMSNQWFADFNTSKMYTKKDRPHQFVYRVLRDLALFDLSDAYAVHELVQRVFKRYQTLEHRLFAKKKNNVALDIHNNVIMDDQDPQKDADFLEFRKMYTYLVAVAASIGQTEFIPQDKYQIMKEHIPRAVQDVYKFAMKLNVTPNIPVTDPRTLQNTHADVFLEQTPHVYHGFGKHPMFLSRSSYLDIDDDLVHCVRDFFPDCDGYIADGMASLNTDFGNAFHPEICLFGNVRKSSSQRKIQLIKVLSEDNALVQDPRLHISPDHLPAFRSFYKNFIRDQADVHAHKKLIADIIDESLSKSSVQQTGSGALPTARQRTVLPSLYQRHGRMMPTPRLQRNPLYFTPTEVEQQYDAYLKKYAPKFPDKNPGSSEEAEARRRQAEQRTRDMKMTPDMLNLFRQPPNA